MDTTTTGTELQGGPSAPSKAPSARRITWARRRKAMAGYWRAYRRNKQGMMGLVILLIIIALALLAPFLFEASQIGVSTATGERLAGPSATNWLGTDKFGRDIVAMLAYGARISLLVGLAATIGTMLIGAVVGITGGYFGGKTDTFFNFLTNCFLVIPWIPLAIVLVALMGRGIWNIVLVIAITSWAGTARIVRAQALTVKERTYVERASALGAGDWHLVTRHVLPNVFPVLFSNMVLAVSLAILSETTLALLGLGDPSTVSWGTMIGESFEAGAIIAGYWWWFIPPGICLVAVTLSFTMCGYALDEILNPKLRQR
jgi:peptide/nickel transport system permease protein